MTIQFNNNNIIFDSKIKLVFRDVYKYKEELDDYFSNVNFSKLTMTEDFESLKSKLNIIELNKDIVYNMVKYNNTVVEDITIYSMRDGIYFFDVIDLLFISVIQDNDKDVLEIFYRYMFNNRHSMIAYSLSLFVDNVLARISEFASEFKKPLYSSYNGKIFVNYWVQFKVGDTLPFIGTYYLDTDSYSPRFGDIFKTNILNCNDGVEILDIKSQTYLKPSFVELISKVGD